MRAKRFGAFFVASFFLFFSLMAPYRAAMAQTATVPVGAFSQAINVIKPVMNIASKNAAGALVSTAIVMGAQAWQDGTFQQAYGNVMESIKVYTNGDSSPALQINIDPKASKPVPPGWTAPAVAGADPIPPSTANSVLWFKTYWNSCPSPSIAAMIACAFPGNTILGITQGGPRDASGNWPANSWGGSCTDKTVNDYCVQLRRDSDGQMGGADAIGFFSAPVGYGNCTSSTCQLTDANAVPYTPDYQCTVIRNGTGISVDARDPDCNTPATVAGQPNVSITPNAVTTYANGKGFVKVETDAATGAVTITNVYPDGAGNTREDKLAVSAPVAGASSPSVIVEGGSTRSYSGVGSLANPNVAAPTATPAQPATSTPAPSIQIPDDYNREATQAQIAGDIGAIKESLSNVSVPNVSVPANAAVPLPADLWKVKYENGFKGVWDAKKEAFTASSFVQALDGFKPGFESGGACPHFNVQFDFPIIGPVSGDLAPPCWLLDAIGVIMLISAAFACRRIIFGG